MARPKKTSDPTTTPKQTKRKTEMSVRREIKKIEVLDEKKESFPDFFTEEDKEVYRNDNFLMFGLVINGERSEIRDVFESVFEKNDSIDIDLSIFPYDVTFTPRDKINKLTSVSNHNYNIFSKNITIDIDPQSDNKDTCKTLPFTVLSLYHPDIVRHYFEDIFNRNLQKTYKKGKIIIQFLNITRENYYSYMAGLSPVLAVSYLIKEDF